MSAGFALIATTPKHLRADAMSLALVIMTARDAGNGARHEPGLHPSGVQGPRKTRRPGPDRRPPRDDHGFGRCASQGPVRRSVDEECGDQTVCTHRLEPPDVDG